MAGIEGIRSRLRDLRRRVAAALFLDAAARVAGALLLAVSFSYALDRVFRLEPVARAIITLAGAGATAWVAFRFLRRRAPGEDPLAVAVERRFPALGDRLISAVQLARESDPERYGMSGQLIADEVEEATRAVEGIRLADVVDSRKVARIGLLGLLALLLPAAAAVADPAAATIWFQRNVLLRDVRWPQKTWLEVDPERFPGGVARIVRGDDLVVSARSAGEIHPERVTILWTDSEGEGGRATMKSDLANHLYRHEFSDIAFPMTFHLEGGDDVTREYRIELMEPPEARDVEVTVGFPEYARREPVACDLAAGDPEMLPGGHVTIRGRSSKPLASMQALLGETEEGAVAGEVKGGDRFEVTLRPEKTALVGIRLRDTDGLSNPSLAPRFLLRVVPDREPKVRLQAEGIGPMVVPVAVIPYVVRVRDDVRAVAGRLETSRSLPDREAPETSSTALPADALGGPTAQVRGELELGPLELVPGSFLRIVAFAADEAQPQAHEGRSDALALKVVSIEDFLNEMLRRQQEQRRDFEQLIEREKRLSARYDGLREKLPATRAEAREEIEGLAREQRQVARRVQAITQAMAQILDEMLHNRVSEPTRIDALRSRVVVALEALRTGLLDPHADSIDALAAEAGDSTLPAELAAEVARGYEKVLAAMNAVLENMVKVEGFTEIVEAVRGLLALHGETAEEVRRRYIAEMRKTFGEGYKPENDPLLPGGK